MYRQKQQMNATPSRQRSERSRWEREVNDKQTNALKKNKQHGPNTLTPTIGTVAVEAVGKQKLTENRENVLKKQQIACKTAASTITTVAMEAAGNQK